MVGAKAVEFAELLISGYPSEDPGNVREEFIAFGIHSTQKEVKN
jgi:hypothetical protein